MNLLLEPLKASALLSRPALGLAIAALLVGCAAERKEVSPKLDPSSPEAPEGSSSVPRSLNGKTDRESSPLEVQEPAPAQTPAADADAGSNKAADAQEKTMAKIVYTCPMHPEVREGAPGKCPKCGMTLIPEKRHQ